MQILSYSPKVEAYASVKDGTEFIDLTPDIVTASVNRVSDGASTFSLRLQNVRNKYNDVFMPMDRVKIYCTKVERVPLITGYVTSVPKYTLYGTDITLNGSCSLYRLQQTYWDPALMESQHLLGFEGSEDNWDSVLINLLTKVGNMPQDSISIGGMPQEIIDWAAKMYAARKEEVSQLKSFVDEFYEVLQTHGPKGTLGASGTSSSSGGGGGLTLSGDENKASDDQKKIAEYALNSDSHGIAAVSGMCLGWVNDVYEAAGFPFARYPGAVDVWRNRESHVSYGTDMSKIPLAACVVGSGVGSGGNGHIGIYIGGGNVISNVGGTRVETVETFGSWQTDFIDGGSGNYGWVAPECGATWK